jgi:transcription termination/antitermination protein NusA
MSSVYNTNISDTISSVASIKSMSREDVISIIEKSVAEVVNEAYSGYGKINVRVERKTGEIILFRIMTVVSKVTDSATEINLEMASSYSGNKVQLGDSIEEYLPAVYRGRRIATKIRNAILREMRTLEKEAEYENFKSYEGEILNCEVKQVDRFRIIVSIRGKDAEAIIPREGMIPNEKVNIRDHINAYVMEVKRSDTDAQIVLSRSDPGFIKRLLQEEVPEIKEGTIEVKSVVRDPGSRAKVSVYSHDPRVEVVAACVGPRGSHIKAIVNELRGEKIDIIPWSRDITEFTKSVMVPAKPIKVNVLDGGKKVEVVVPNDQVSLAIGRRGQNVRLASKMLGCDVSIISEEVKQANFLEKFAMITKQFVEAMDVEEMVAQLLAAEGFMDVESIASSEVADIAKIQGFDINIAQQVQQRAVDFLENQKVLCRNTVEEHKMEPALVDMLNMNYASTAALAQAGIIKLQDLADLSTDELSDILPQGVYTADQMSDMILQARKSVYSI